MTLRIRTLARLTGLREATLRAWERRHGFPRPDRSDNNYRTYNRDEVEQVRRVTTLIASGLSVSEAITQVRGLPTGALPPVRRFQERFWSAVLVLDGDAASRALQEAHAALPPVTLCDQVLLPLLRELSDRLDVAREHLASAIVRQRLRILLEEVEAVPTGRCAVLACAPGEHHEGGLLGIALHLKLEGWTVVGLGADTPVEALGAAVRAVGPEVLALSFVRSREPGEIEQVLRQVVETVACPVVVGGASARGQLREILAAGAHYAESASEVAGVLPTGQP